MPELGALEAGQAASLVGLAPIARQSGRWNGRALFEAAAPAFARPSTHARPRRDRFNPDLKTKYARLIEAGKPAKVALDAIMRKRVVLANALLKANRRWTPKSA
jgi:transposase